MTQNQRYGTGKDASDKKAPNINLLNSSFMQTISKPFRDSNQQEFSNQTLINQYKKITQNGVLWMRVNRFRH